MRLINWIVTVPVALLAISFAASNRDVVDVSLWPLPFEIPLPVAAIGFIGVFLGFILGGIASWLSAGRTRSRARKAERRANEQAREIQTLEKKVADRNTALSHQPHDQNTPASQP